MMIKALIHQENVIPNMYAPKNTVSKYKKQKLLELIGKLCSTQLCSTNTIRDFNTIVSGQVDRKIKKDIKLNYTINLFDLISIYRTFYPITSEYIFFSSAHETFIKIHHILGHKKCFKELKLYKIF